MKVLLLIIIFIGIPIFVLVKVVNPIFNQAETCFEQGKQQYNSLTDSAQQKILSQQQKCTQGKLVINSMLNCLQDLEESQLIAPRFVMSLITNFSSVAEQLPHFIRTHNNSCPNYPETWIKEEVTVFYTENL